MSTILGDVKDCLMIGSEEKAFDKELIMHITSAIATLNQIGVGEFVDIDETTEWSSFINPDLLSDKKRLGHARHYIFLKVKLLFDPPPSTSAGYLDTNANEMLWRAKEG